MSEARVELLRKIARASTAIDPGLSDRDVERLIAGWHRLGTRRTVRRALAGIAVLSGVVAVAVSIGGLSRQGRPTSAGVARLVKAPPAAGQAPAPVAALASRAPLPAVEPVGPRARTVRFPDGSLAMPVDDGTELTVRESSVRRIALDLDRGRGRFRVTPVAQRTFVVKAGSITVTVLGSSFTVERVSDRVAVGVEQGRVLVEWGSGSAELQGGASGWFPPPAAPSRGTSPTTVAVARSGVTSKKAPAVEPPEPTAHDPVHASAPAPPAVDPPDPALPLDPEGLASSLESADLARTAGNPAEAAMLLRRALERHGADRRAPLAAFTLGRILLVQLDRPREAAAAFAQARALAPDGPLAEDALAREIESWSRAGENGRTRALAQEYVHRYPTGRRLPSVRDLGGLE